MSKPFYEPIHSPVFGNGWSDSGRYHGKYHYFAECTVSICGRAVIGAMETANKTPPEKLKCKACLQKLAERNRREAIMDNIVKGCPPTP